MSGLPGQQMAARYRTVALQAVGVAVIAAFVFIAFLRPSEPGDLSGIDAPGGENPFVIDPERPKTGGGPDKSPGGKNSSKRGGNSSGAGLGALAALVGVAAGGDSSGGGGTTVPPGGGGGGEDPPGNQYDDLPTALMAEVGMPAIFREIDP